MGRKKKPAKPERPAEPKPQKIGTSLKGLLKEVSLASEPEPAKPAKPRTKKRAKPPKPEAAPPAPPTEAKPSEHLSGDDRIAFYDAIAGVRPLGNKGGVGPKKKRNRDPGRAPVQPPTTSDDLVRARLGALVAGGVRFEVHWDDDHVTGRRAGVGEALCTELGRRGIAPEATLDLHGHSSDAAERALVKFVRAQHRRGARRLCVVHGKGTHSEGGVGVLRDVVVRALTEGGAAPVVRAFATAATELGGSGALIVQLER